MSRFIGRDYQHAGNRTALGIVSLNGASNLRPLARALSAGARGS
jgi:hypothetical protein